MTREEFAALLADRAALVSVTDACGVGQKIAEEYRIALSTEIKARKPRTRIPTDWHKVALLADRVLGDERVQQITAPFWRRIEEEQKKVEARRAEIDLVLNVAAPTLVSEIRRTAEPALRYYWLYGGMYSSQGYGCERYSMAHLDRVAAPLKAQFGLATKVTDAPGGWNLLVNVESETDVEIVSRAVRPETLREFVRSCWSKGVNPRVYNPFIPADFETRAGLDHFGGEISKED